MTLEEQIKVTVLEAVREAIRAELPVALMAAATGAEGGNGDPLDYKALEARGYSQREANAMLHAWGVKVPGGRKRRISPDVLSRVEHGDPPT